MAKVTFDTMPDEVNCRIGNVVYSEWKGIKYARKFKKPEDANTEQQKLRGTVLIHFFMDRYISTVPLITVFPDVSFRLTTTGKSFFISQEESC